MKTKLSGWAGLAIFLLWAGSAVAQQQPGRRSNFRGEVVLPFSLGAVNRVDEGVVGYTAPVVSIKATEDCAAIKEASALIGQQYSGPIDAYRCNPDPADYVDKSGNITGAKAADFLQKTKDCKANPSGRKILAVYLYTNGPHDFGGAVCRVGPVSGEDGFYACQPCKGSQ